MIFLGHARLTGGREPAKLSMSHRVQVFREPDTWTQRHLQYLQDSKGLFWNLRNFLHRGYGCALLTRTRWWGNIGAAMVVFWRVSLPSLRGISSQGTKTGETCCVVKCGFGLKWGREKWRRLGTALSCCLEVQADAWRKSWWTNWASGSCYEKSQRLLKLLTLDTKINWHLAHLFIFLLCFWCVSAVCYCSVFSLRFYYGCDLW